MCVLHGGNGSCVHTHLEKRLRHLSRKNCLPYIFEFVLTELCNIIKTCIVISLTLLISIYVNSLNRYIKLKLRCKHV